MMTKQSHSTFCLFQVCNKGQLDRDEEYIMDSRMNSPKKPKTSLKKNVSRPSILTQTKSKVYSPPVTVVERVERVQRSPITVRLFQQPMIRFQPLTPKPKISFSWSADLDQTKKIQPPQEELPPAASEPEHQLSKTKQKNKSIRKLTDPDLYKASMISIQDVSPKLPPKVEESIIMVDYFNPPEQILSKLEEMIENRSRKEVL